MVQVSNTGRGSGRTFNQLAALPDGSLFLVHHGGMVDHAKQCLVNAGRKSDAVRIEIATLDAGHRYAGLPSIAKIDADHALFENAPRMIQNTVNELIIRHNGRTPSSP